MIVRKTSAELEKMRQSGLLVWRVLKKLGEMAVEGVSTLDLEVAAEKMIAEAGARPAFKNYFVPAAGERYKYVLCTSINEEIVHGMPSAKRVLKSGDIVSIDTGVELNGYYGDSALTVAVGQVNEEARRLTLDVHGPGTETRLELAWISVAEWRDLLERAGFEIEALYGWFDRRPYAAGEDSIWLARRP